jgi:muramidase (phage lysozyme)
MEFSPEYVDVIIQRYVDFTNNNKIIKNGKIIEWSKNGIKE